MTMHCFYETVSESIARTYARLHAFRAKIVLAVRCMHVCNEQDSRNSTARAQADTQDVDQMCMP